MKLYFLHASDPEFYRWVLPKGVTSPHGKFVEKPAPLGFAIVKESWSPIEVELADVPRLPADSDEWREFPAEYRIEGDRAFRTDKPRDLFIMIKQDPTTPDTDEGWIYGTVTADGSTVTSAGRVQACMDCHAKASRDHLFGMHLSLARPEAR